MQKLQPLELLAPARDFAHGSLAILSGADAVYIGAPAFSARQSVNASMEDISQLVEFAHQYSAKVYVALNTIIYDDEITEVQKIINALHEAKVDALIIQDMGILEMELPPIPLFASTQCDIRTPEKALFLEKVGFQRLILARELSLTQIEKIRAKTKVDLETFVHGALCVSYSGQCYLSQALCNRSGNRGQCAQPCRMRYDLVDNNGKSIAKNQHLLSLKDFNLSASLEELAEQGIASFKIEGRLKDASYVQNITAYYRGKLDELITKFPEKYTRASVGTCQINFTPNPVKTFNRTFTDYFLHGRPAQLTSFDTEKSRGEYMGKIKTLSNYFFTLDKSKATFTPGDGICFLSATGEFSGTNVNKFQDGKIFPHKLDGLAVGMEIWRNLDHAFEKILAQNPPERKIGVSLALVESTDGFLLTATDADGLNAEVTLTCEKIPAKDSIKSQATIREQLAKSGETIFMIRKIKIKTAQAYFFPIKTLNTLRRDVLAKLHEMRLEKARPQEHKIRPNTSSFPQTKLDYRANIANRFARKFYERHGAAVGELAYELQDSPPEKEIARTKYCLRHELGHCLKKNPGDFKLPLFLKNQKNTIRLEFDCANCEMRLLK